MNRKWALPLLIAAVLIAGVVFTRHPLGNTQPQTRAASAIPAHSVETVAINRSPEEIFQRAFWRRPTAADRIVHADRREWSAEDKGVQRWQWFIQVEPGAELLNALRDPAHLGLVRSTTPKASVEPMFAPDWFPAAAQLIGCEILQSPSAGLIVYYQAAGNVLFATDAGRGFAPPAASLANR